MVFRLSCRYWKIRMKNESNQRRKTRWNSPIDETYLLRGSSENHTYSLRLLGVFHYSYRLKRSSFTLSPNFSVMCSIVTNLSCWTSRKHFPAQNFRQIQLCLLGKILALLWKRINLETVAGSGKSLQREVFAADCDWHSGGPKWQWQSQRQ